MNPMFKNYSLWYPQLVKIKSKNRIERKQAFKSSIIKLMGSVTKFQ